MYCLTRKFHSVGQGLFCTEKFKFPNQQLNVVYDCGSRFPGEAFVDGAIRKAFDENEPIDCVFISHFDEDHINGIPFLLDYCNVHKIYIPRISNIYDIAYWRIKAEITGGRYGRLIRAIIDQLEVRRGRPLLANSAGAEVPIEWIHSSASRRNGYLNAVNFGCVNGVWMREYKWAYIPYIYEVPERVEIMESGIKEVARRRFGYRSVRAFLNHPERYLSRLSQKECKKMLTEINTELALRFDERKAGDVNSNSVVVYSGPTGLNTQCAKNKSIVYEGGWSIHPYSIKGKFRKEKISVQKIGCLYTGDFNASDPDVWEDLVSYYMERECCPSIGCVQIPHHGSEHNYNVGIAQMDACAVVSYGINNQFGHPHWLARKMMSRLRQPIFYVNDKYDCVGRLCWRKDFVYECELTDTISGCWETACLGCSYRVPRTRRNYYEYRFGG